VPLAFAFRRVLILSPFILTLCLAVLWYDHSWHRVAIGAWSATVAGGTLTAVSITIKFVLGVLALTALTSTTPFSALLEAMRRLGVPRLLTMQLGFLYRYLFVLLDEAMRVRRGRDFRGAALAPVGRRLAAVGGIVGSLFVRTLERSDRIHLAMTARGYRGEPHALTVAHLHLADVVVAVAAAAYLVFCRWGYPAVL
jgi:cobalt/nickel transport system permease protein